MIADSMTELSLSPDGHMLAVLQPEDRIHDVSDKPPVFHLMSWKDGRLLGEVKFSGPLLAFDPMLQVTDAGRIWFLLEGPARSYLWAIDGAKVATGSAPFSLQFTAPWSTISPDCTAMLVYSNNPNQRLQYFSLQVIDNKVIAAKRYTATSRDVGFFWYPDDSAMGNTGTLFGPNGPVHGPNGWVFDGMIPHGNSVMQWDASGHLRVFPPAPAISWRLPVKTSLALPENCSSDGSTALVTETLRPNALGDISRLPLLKSLLTQPRYQLVVYSHGHLSAFLPLEQRQTIIHSDCSTIIRVVPSSSSHPSSCSAEIYLCDGRRHTLFRRQNKNFF